jgi:hypothetical protein
MPNRELRGKTIELKERATIAALAIDLNII